MSRCSLFLLVVMVLPSFGYTDCDDFDTVTVPPADNNPPSMATRMWIDGQELLRLDWADEVSETGNIMIVPVVYDSGGAREIDFSQSVQVSCLSGSIGTRRSVYFLDQSASQSGTVGSQVSNGIYLLGDVSDLSAYDYLCSSGFYVSRVVYSWNAVGSDFHGNTATFYGNIFYYP